MKSRRVKKKKGRLIETSNFTPGDMYYFKFKKKHVFSGMAHVRHK